MKQLIQQLIQRWNNRGCHVTLDPSDNSVTMSPRLISRIPFVEGKENNVLVFQTDTHFCFTLNPTQPQLQRCQLNTIQQDPRTGDIGFETLRPTVNLIFYRYGFPADEPPTTLPVTTHTSPEGMTYYQIEHPIVCRR